MGEVKGKRDFGWVEEGLVALEGYYTKNISLIVVLWEVIKSGTKDGINTGQIASNQAKKYSTEEEEIIRLWGKREADTVKALRVLA